MAFSKIIAESMDLSDTYNFTGTLQQNGAGIGGNNKPYFQASVSSDVSLSDGTHTAIVCNQETLDTGSLFNTSTGKFTMDSTNAGKYYIFFRASLDADTNFSSTGNYFGAELRKYNSSNALQQTHRTRMGFSNIYWPTAVAVGVFDLANGDYVIPYAIVTSSGRTIIGTSGSFQYLEFAGYKLID